MVSNIVLRPPAVPARQALTVAELSGGRLDLGVGSDYAPTDPAAGRFAFRRPPMDTNPGADPVVVDEILTRLTSISPS